MKESNQNKLPPNTSESDNKATENNDYDRDYQICPICGTLIGIIPGSRDAICHNCGFKDPCCE